MHAEGRAEVGDARSDDIPEGFAKQAVESLCIVFAHCVPCGDAQRRASVDMGGDMSCEFRQSFTASK
jgi:hypothetical protein